MILSINNVFIKNSVCFQMKEISSIKNEIKEVKNKKIRENTVIVGDMKQLKVIV
jgi:hypothetical protein